MTHDDPIILYNFHGSTHFCGYLEGLGRINDHHFQKCQTQKKKNRLWSLRCMIYLSNCWGLIKFYSCLFYPCLLNLLVNMDGQAVISKPN